MDRLNSSPRRLGAFTEVDLTDFWDDGDYSRGSYQEPAPDDETIAALETELGFRFPDSYVELARLQNGGLVNRTCHPSGPSSWADDHVAIAGILAIGRTSRTPRAARSAPH